MKARKIKDRVSLIGAVDWERRLFDGLIALPDGTSYNSYLVQGSEKTALIDTVDPFAKDVLLAQLADIPSIDYVVAHHAEQDHSGTIPVILDKYKNAKLICTTKAKDMLIDLMPAISSDRVQTVSDKESISLGDKTLEFIYTPWVHWPETMCTYLREDHILFSCDFFGAHLATADIFVTEKERTAAAAKRYFAEIMMPFRPAVRNNINKLCTYQIDIIAPSHGPLHNDPSFIINAHEDWISEQPKNLCLIPYVSMHGSTKQMVDYLVNALFVRGVRVKPFDLTVTDLGTLAMDLVDAATVVFGAPTVLVGPHPAVLYAAVLANALRPKTKFASIIGSYGWATQAKEQIIAMIPNLKVELLTPVMCKGAPKAVDFQALDSLADAIAAKHKGLELV